jgi:hypothetical protein
MTKRRSFTVKSLTMAQPFNCTGVMTDTGQVQEVETVSEAEAAWLLARTNMELNTKALHNVNLVINLHVKPTRADVKFVRESLGTWAEKSRIPNLRGYRANAVRTPRVKQGVIDTSVLLGDTIYYNDSSTPREFHSDVTAMIKDVRLLEKLLVRKFPAATVQASFHTVTM